MAWKTLARKFVLVFMMAFGMVAAQTLLFLPLTRTCAVFEAEAIQLSCPACSGLGPLVAAELARHWWTVEELAVCTSRVQPLIWP